MAQLPCVVGLRLSEYDPIAERQGVELDVQPIARTVRERSAYPCPDRLLAFAAILDAVSDVWVACSCCFSPSL
jgi:hypothetical protein